MKLHIFLVTLPKEKKKEQGLNLNMKKGINKICMCMLLKYVSVISSAFLFLFCNVSLKNSFLFSLAFEPSVCECNTVHTYLYVNIFVG